MNRRLLQNVAQDATDLSPREMTVPSAAFTCAERLAGEREHLFRAVPQPVAFSAEIPDPGSVLALRVLNVPVVLSRDEAGELRAFVNACSHRGAQVADGAGQRRRMVCPFHGWAYGLDGRLLGRPGDRHFDTPRTECGLTALPLLERHGLVVVGIDPELPPDRLDTALDDVGEELSELQLGSYWPIARRSWDVKANWKLVNDLSLESYHFHSLHHDSVARVLAANAVVDTWRRCSRWAFPLKSITRLAELEESAWPDRVEGSCTYTLYPGVMVIVNETGAQMIRAEPGDAPDRTRVTYAGVRAPDCDPEAARRAWEFGGDVFEREDLPAAEQCQLGLSAGRREVLLGRNEPLLQFWHGLWDDALR